MSSESEVWSLSASVNLLARSENGGGKLSPLSLRKAVVLSLTAESSDIKTNKSFIYLGADPLKTVYFIIVFYFIIFPLKQLLTNGYYAMHVARRQTDANAAFRVFC